MDLRPGEVWWAHPDPGTGREQSGRRPVVVVSSPLHLRVADTLAFVVPVTSRDRGWPNHVPLPRAAGLGATGFAMSERLRVISRDRLSGRAGSVDGGCLAEIAVWIADLTIADPTVAVPAGAHHAP